MTTSIGRHTNLNVCFSGGCVGSDMQWGNAAKKAGHKVWHIRVCNKFYHDTWYPTRKELEQGNEFLTAAAKQLNRTFPSTKEYVNKLIQRDYWQAVAARDNLYAVGEFFKRPNTDNHKVPAFYVKGGTAWAIHTHWALKNESRRIFFYEQKRKRWYTVKENLWIICDQVPKPSGIYTAIGTRYINSDGRRAIRQLFVK